MFPGDGTVLLPAPDGRIGSLAGHADVAESIVLDEDDNRTKAGWKLEYRYLGYRLRWDLDECSVTAHVSRLVKGSLHRLFPYHRTVRNMPVPLQLQLLKSLVIGCASFILPLVSAVETWTALAALDKDILLAARGALRMDKNVGTTALVTATCGLVPLPRLALGARARLRSGLVNHPWRSATNELQWPIACRIYDALVVEAGDPASTGGSTHRSWVVDTDHRLGTACREYPALADPTGWQSAGPAASAVARHAAYSDWLTAMSGPESLAVPFTSFANRPAPVPTSNHSFAIHFIRNRLATCSTAGAGGAVAMTGLIPHRTPLSSRGPGCSGGLVAIANIRPQSASLLAVSAHGARSLTLARFLRPPPAPRGAGPLGAAQERHRAVLHTCPRCGWSGDFHAIDLWHFLFECTEKLTAAIADTALDRVRTTLDKVVDCTATCLQRIVDGLWPPLPGRPVEWYEQTQLRCDALGAALMALRTAITAIKALQATDRPRAWGSMAGRWVQYMILLAVPFSEADVEGVGVPPQARVTRSSSAATRLPPVAPAAPDGVSQLASALAKALGRVFDLTVMSNSEVRPLATAWCDGSSRVLGHLIRKLRRLHQAPDPRAPHGTPLRAAVHHALANVIPCSDALADNRPAPPAELPPSRPEFAPLTTALTPNRVSGAVDTGRRLLLLSGLVHYGSSESTMPRAGEVIRMYRAEGHTRILQHPSPSDETLISRVATVAQSAVAVDEINRLHSVITRGTPSAATDRVATDARHGVLALQLLAAAPPLPPPYPP
jgi:hypothetical protein